MRRRRSHYSFLLAATGLCSVITGCHSTFEGSSANPAFIQVSLDPSQPTGSAEAPLPFSSEVTEVMIIAETLDQNGDPWPYNGSLTLETRPAKLDGNPWVEVEDGRWEGLVSIRNGYGPTRIWLSDKGEMSPADYVPTWATGVSDPMFFEFPTIGEMNRTGDPETNHLDGEFAEIRAVDRSVIVTAVGTNGFWVTDTMDAQGEHNSLFVYSFSAPGEEIELGKRLTLLTGANQEYLATTQISFPAFDVADEPAVTPPPASDIEDFCGDEMVLEGYESAVVTVAGAAVPTGFGADPNDEDYTDYLDYGQWPLTLSNGCTLYVDSSVPCPGFRPTDSLALSNVSGLLNQVWDKWIILIRDGDDLPAGMCASDNDTTAPPAPSRPLPREAPSHRRL